MNVFRVGSVLVLVSLFLSGCDLNSEDSASPAGWLIERSFFDDGDEGWIAEFADYPEGLEDSMKLAYKPSPLFISESIGSVSAFKQSGYATNSDLFMFVKQQISGLEPNSRYIIRIEVELNSQLKEEYTGDLDNSQYGSFLKVGAFKTEPKTIIEQDDDNPDISLIKTDFDKGEDDQGGQDMAMIGRLEYTTPGEKPILLNGSNVDFPIYAATDAEGKLWIAVGIDTNIPVYQEVSYTYINATFQFEDSL
jgi:hypothetical protein